MRRLMWWFDTEATGWALIVLNAACVILGAYRCDSLIVAWNCLGLWFGIAGLRDRMARRHTE